MELNKRIYKKVMNVLVWLISLQLAWVFIQYGWPKFDPDGFWTTAFTERWGYGMLFMHFIGVLEVAGAVAILIPRIATYGGITLAVVMLGALITRLIHGVSLEDVLSIIGFLITSLFIAFYWIGQFPFLKIVSEEERPT